MVHGIAVADKRGAQRTEAIVRSFGEEVKGCQGHPGAFLGKMFQEVPRSSSPGLGWISVRGHTGIQTQW